MDPRDVKLLAAVLLIGAVASLAWHFRNSLAPPPGPPAEMPVKPAPAEPETVDRPKHPIAPPKVVQGQQRKLVPLPPLDDSDAYFLMALVDVLGTGVEALLVEDALIDRFVTTVDNLPRDHVAEKVRPVGRLSEPFRADTTGDDAPVYLSSDNYRRYDSLVSQLAAADTDAVVDIYRRFYPLFQQSYERLGYPDRYFNDRVIEVIDHLLETPRPDEPIRLARPHVLYEFADPELQSLSSGRKLLLRMGSDHAAVVKKVMRELRAELAQPSEAVLPAEAVLETD